MNIALYFGTFNPIHVGHMAIANYILEFASIDRLWFVITPQSPFKQKQSILNNYHRMELVTRAIDNDPRMKASSIEFKLPQPAYTIDTLTYLQESYPQHHFSILMGADNLASFRKWKNYEQILANYGIIVYPRPGFPKEEMPQFPNLHFTDAPLIEISSTFIRQSIREGRDIRHFLPKEAWNYIDEMGFYRK